MVDILAFGAHPDDIEFGCGGILTKAAAQGCRVGLVHLTHGEKGTYGNPESRQKEAERAAEIIGAKCIFLNFTDCEIFDTYEGRLQIVKAIRQERPRLVLAPYWKGENTHPDHLACGLMCRYACRYARFGKILPEFPVHRVEGILHYPYGNSEKIDFLIDVSEHVKKWEEMMKSHETQMNNFPYWEWVLKIAAKQGVLIDKPYAQGLISGNPVVVENIMDISHCTREI